MSFETCPLPGAIIVRPKVYSDSRGYFKEISRKDKYAENGIFTNFVQVNMSYSKHNVIRGMHYQLKSPQAKLVSVAYGRIYDVIIDCRKSSPAFGKWFGIELSAEGGEELFVPEGFAHGFRVLSDSAAVVYQCSDYYNPADEYGINIFSPSLAIDWACPDAIVSDKDRILPSFDTVEPNNLPE